MDTKWNELAEWVQAGIDSADTQGVEAEPNEDRREGVVEGLGLILWKMKMLDQNATEEEMGASLDKRAKEKLTKVIEAMRKVAGAYEH